MQENDSINSSSTRMLQIASKTGRIGNTTKNATGKKQQLLPDPLFHWYMVNIGKQQEPSQPSFGPSFAPVVRLNRASAVVLDFEPRTNSASSGSLVSEMGRQMNLVFSVQFMAPGFTLPGTPGTAKSPRGKKNSKFDGIWWNLIENMMVDHDFKWDFVGLNVFYEMSSSSIDY